MRDAEETDKEDKTAKVSLEELRDQLGKAKREVMNRDTTLDEGLEVDLVLYLVILWMSLRGATFHAYPRSNNVDPLVNGFGQIYLTVKYI